MVDRASEVRHLNVSLPAVAASVPPVREALAELAAAGGASEEECIRVRLVASEAVNNAVLHAFDGRPGEISIAAAVLAGELVILIADDGLGMRPDSDSEGLGLGLRFMAELSDELTLVTRPSGGLEVRLVIKLSAAESRPRESPPRVADFC